MRLLLEAIIASLGHYGNSLYVEIEMNPFELAEILDVEQSSERFAEIEKLSNKSGKKWAQHGQKPGGFLNF